MVARGRGKGQGGFVMHRDRMSAEEEYEVLATDGNVCNTTI